MRKNGGYITNPCCCEETSPFITKAFIFFSEEIFANLTRLAESHTHHGNSCPCNKKKGNLMQPHVWSHSGSTVFGQVCFLSRGCPGCHRDLCRWCFGWVVCESFVLKEEASALLKMKEKREKETHGPSFCLSSDYHTKFAGREWHTDLLIHEAELFTDVLCSFHHRLGDAQHIPLYPLLFSTASASYRNLLTCLPKVKV